MIPRCNHMSGSNECKLMQIILHSTLGDRRVIFDRSLTQGKAIQNNLKRNDINEEVMTKLP